MECLECCGVELLVGLFHDVCVKPIPAAAGHHEEVHRSPAVFTAILCGVSARACRSNFALHADFDADVLGKILVCGSEIDADGASFAGVCGLAGVGDQSALAAFGFRNFVFVHEAVEVATVVAGLAVGLLHSVQNIRVENAVGALLASDNGHVAIVFGAGVPNVRNDAVCLGVLRDFAVEEGAALQVELEICCVGDLAGALDGTEFADDYRNALIAEHGLEFTEGLLDLVRGAERACCATHVVGFVGGAFKAGVVVELVTPAFICGHERILIWIIVDFGHHVAVACRVSGPVLA